MAGEDQTHASGKLAGEDRGHTNSNALNNQKAKLRMIPTIFPREKNLNQQRRAALTVSGDRKNASPSSETQKNHKKCEKALRVHNLRGGASPQRTYAQNGESAIYGKDESHW